MYLAALLFTFQQVSAQPDTTFGRHDPALNTVTVTGRKKAFEQKTDRMIINVKGSVTTAGGTALDVLERCPGISVDRQGNSISIRGKSGVTIMINGKVNYMPADALVQFLAGLNAGNIGKIELINAPPSKYDAGGNAGFINIVLINNPYAGSSGSYFATAGYGMRESSAAGINLNHKAGRLSLSGNLSVNYDHYIQTGTSLLQYSQLNDFIGNYSYMHRDATRWVENIRAVADYQIDTATSIGVLVSGGSNHWLMTAHNGSNVSRSSLPDTVISMVDDPESNHWKNVTTNINFQHTFQPGKILSLDANYIYYKDDNPNSYSTDYYTDQKAFLYHEDIKSGKSTPVRFRVFSADYATPLGSQVKMEAGGKISFSTFTNDLSSDDIRFTSHQALKENISAAYTSFTMDLGSRLSITAGLRYEYTDSRLSSTTAARDVKRKYGELFPTLSISKRADGDKTISLSYHRRINRPAFNDLAPFTIFFDPKTFYSGNPALQPSIASTVQTAVVTKHYSFTVSYTYDDNAIANYYFQTRKIDPVRNLLYLSSGNFRYAQDLTSTLTIPIACTSWWDMQYTINASQKWIGALFEDQPGNLRNFDFGIAANQHFMLPHDIAAELSGSYISPIYIGTAKRRALYQVNAGLQKKLRSGRDIIQLSANDIFNSGSNYSFEEKLPGGGYIARTFDFNGVACKLSYTHNFGNNGFKRKDRATGAEDELKRVL